MTAPAGIQHPATSSQQRCAGATCIEPLNNSMTGSDALCGTCRFEAPASPGMSRSHIPKRVALSLIALQCGILTGFAMHTCWNPVILHKYSPAYFVFLIALGLSVFLTWPVVSFLLRPSNIRCSAGQSSTRVLRPGVKITLFAILLLIGTVLAEMFYRWKWMFPRLEEESYRFELEFHPYLQNRFVDPDADGSKVLCGGFRGRQPTIEKPANTFRIFFVGGSTVLCDRVPLELSCPYLVEKLLVAAGASTRIEVYNAGNHWHTTQHTLMKYLFDIRDYSPDALVVWHGINDLCRSFSETSYASGLVDYQRDYSHFLGPLAPVIDHKRQIRNHSLSPVVIRLEMLSSLASCWFSDLRERSGAALGRKGASPGERGIPLADNEFKSINSFDRNLRSLAAVTKQDGVKLILATQPFFYNAEMSEEESRKLWMNKAFCRTAEGFADIASMARGLAMFNERTKAVAREYSIPLLDLETAVPKKVKYFSDDVHYTVAGNRLVADTIVDFVLANRILEMPPLVDSSANSDP